MLNDMIARNEPELDKYQVRSSDVLAVIVAVLLAYGPRESSKGGNGEYIRPLVYCVIVGIGP